MKFALCAAIVSILALVRTEERSPRTLVQAHVADASVPSEPGAPTPEPEVSDVPRWLAPGSGNSIVVWVDPSSATVASISINCGGGEIRETDFFQGLPACGTTPALAIQAAIAQACSVLSMSYECEWCEIPGRCKLGVETFADGWSWDEPVWQGDMNAWCGLKYITSASYSGEYAVHCTPCE